MRNFLTFVFFITNFITLGQDQWIIKDSINGAPRSAAASFVANGEGYVVTGLDASGFRRKNYSYTYWQDDWDDETSIGGLNGSGLARGSASGFSIGNKGYVCLGQGTTAPFMRDLWEYDVFSKTWTQKADFTGEARRSAVAFSIDTIAYVGTGIAASGFKRDMFKYSATTNTWSQVNDFGGTPRKEAVGFTMGGQGYIGTGDDGVYKKDFWQYQPNTDTWIQKADFPGTARKGAVGWGIFPTAFICMGEDLNFVYTKDLWEYNYFDDTWVQRANFPGPGRTNGIAFVLQGVAFVGSGYDGIFYDDIFAYRRIVGLEEQGKYAKVLVYPTPAKEVINVEVDPNNIEIKLFAMNGKETTNTLTINTTSNGFKIYRNELPAGNYFIQLNHKERGVVFKSKVILAE